MSKDEGAKDERSLIKMLDRLDQPSILVTNGEWSRIASALRLAVEWLDMVSSRPASASADAEMWHYNQCSKAREAFRRALEGEADA